MEETMKIKKKIAIVGATGMLGVPVTKELVKTGFAVTALVRNKAKAEKVLPESIDIVAVDLQDSANLADGLKGMDGIYLNLSVAATEKETDFHAEKEGLANVIAAAKNNKVKRIAYISSIISRDYTDINWWVFDMKREAISTLKASGLDYTIFYPSSFMENLNNTFIQGEKVNIVGKPLFKNWWIAGEDYGIQVAKSFEILKANENREYTVQGPEPLMMEEAVDIFIKHYKRQALKVGKAPLALLKFLGLFNPQLKYASRILEVINNCEETFEAQSTWNDLGKPQITVLKYTEGLNA